MTAMAPARSAGSVDVVVANPDGQSSRLTGGFTYVGSAPPPPPLAGTGRPDAHRDCAGVGHDSRWDDRDFDRIGIRGRGRRIV